MTKPRNINIKQNTAYYNFELLRELDYVIGGYGKATQEFVFNFNNFVESFILNENFLLSNQEWNHHFLTTKATFPKGRPMTELVITHKNGMQIMGFPFYAEMGKVLYAEDVPSSIDKKGESELYVDFQEKNKEYLNEKYFKPKKFEDFETKYLVLMSDYSTSQKADSKRFVVIESNTTPTELLSGLYKALPNTNFQTTIPLTGFKAQLEINKGLGVSKSTIETLKKLHDIKIEELVKFSGYRKIPIPPLVPILLSQCNTIDDIPDKLLQLRNDYQELRHSFLNYEKNISEAKNLKEQFKINKEYTEFWEAFSRKNKINTNRLMFHFWDLGKESKIIDSIENVVDSGSFDDFIGDLSFTKLGAKGIGKIMEYFKDRKALNRYKGITNLWDLFQKSPTLENQVKDLERIFGIKVDINALNRIAKTVNK
ncbi:hypothetical protein HER15_05250 [Tenacibaculum mesophilum]|uniref:Uncharacterized protein n=1 Tax=Tenacibaculum mesophilum TaxID=104268 RepID=A0AAE9MNY8_9FLAO|nr:hypothetical protein [Tenacibaculum mesophilum]UTD14920.1 hypothetical protein HER15_05250 [Tenacibaculum mesophilum]